MLVATFVRSGYSVLRSVGEGGLKKSECDIESEHSRFFFLKTRTHAHTFFEAFQNPTNSQDEMYSNFQGEGCNF